MALCTFWLFPKNKIAIVIDVDEIKENMAIQLMVIPKKDFAEYFEQVG